MGEANPNPVVSMGLEMMESELYHFYHDPVLWTANGAQHPQVNGVAPDAKTPVQEPPSGLKGLAPTTAEAVPDPTGTVIPRVNQSSKGKSLTPFRMKRIQAFNDLTSFNPEEPWSERIGSATWIQGLVNFLNRFSLTPVTRADVTHWLKESKDFFYSEIVRIISKQKLRERSPSTVSEFPVPTTTSAAGGTARTLMTPKPVEVSTLQSSSNLNPVTSDLAHAGTDQPPEKLERILEVFLSPMRTTAGLLKEGASGHQSTLKSPLQNASGSGSLTDIPTVSPNANGGGHNDDPQGVPNSAGSAAPKASSSSRKPAGKKERGGFLYQSNENSKRVMQAKLAKKSRDLTKQKISDLEEKIEKLTMERDSLIGLIRSKGMEPPIGKDQVKVNPQLAESAFRSHPELARLLAKPTPQQNGPYPACGLPNPTTTDGGTARQLVRDDVAPGMASSPESSSDSKDDNDITSLVEYNNQPEAGKEYLDPEQAQTGIEEIKSTPSNVIDHEPLTIPSSTGVPDIKPDVTSDLAQVPTAVRNLYDEGVIEIYGDLNPMLLYLAETDQLPADKEDLQLFTKVLLKLVEKAVKEGSGQGVNLEACFHAMCAMKAIVEWGGSGH